ncbi:MAG: hydrogenase maturation protease [Desulfobaccales bacterium]
MLPAAAKHTPEVKSAPGRILLLVLGHDFLGDEDAGRIAAGLLKDEFRNGVDIIAGPGALALLGLLECYDRVLLLDAVYTREVPPGTVLEFCRADFHPDAAPADHYLGLPEVLRLAERMGLEFPRELRILALEVENPWEARQGLGPVTRQALPGFVDRARQVLKHWRKLP